MGGLLLPGAAGCSVVGRTTVDIRPADGVPPAALGGPYYVIDEIAVTKADGGIRKSEVLHDACQRRYPGLFSKGRQATPLLVKRRSHVVESDRKSFKWWNLLQGLTICLWPEMGTRTAVIADAAEICGSDGAVLASKGFESRESVYIHTPLTLPFNALLFPAREGWGEETLDVYSPSNRVNEVRQNAFADAIVAGLETMTESDRAALQANADAQALYYRLRPYVIGGDIPGLAGKIVHEAPIVRHAADGRIPVLISFDYDPERRRGRLASDFARCDALFAQQWTIQRHLLGKLREAMPLPGSPSILIRAESLSPEGVYTLDFSVVE